MRINRRVRLDETESCRLFMQLCSAVSYAHRMGVVHRYVSGMPGIYGIPRLQVLSWYVTDVVHGYIIGTSLVYDGRRAHPFIGLSRACKVLPWYMTGVVQRYVIGRWAPGTSKFTNVSCTGATTT